MVDTQVHCKVANLKMFSGFLNPPKIIRVTAAELASHDHTAGGGEVGLSTGLFSLLCKEGRVTPTGFSSST